MVQSIQRWLRRPRYREGGTVSRFIAEHSKSKRDRSVPLNDGAVAVLEEVGVKSAGLAFPNPATKSKYVSIRKGWVRLSKAAVLTGMRIHDCRHVFESRLVAAGRTLYGVQAILGHSPPIVTQRYAHLSTKTLQEAANAASVIVKPATAGRRFDAANTRLVVTDAAAATATPQAVVTAAESKAA